jgi:hypothetical protein
MVFRATARSSSSTSNSRNSSNCRIHVVRISRRERIGSIKALLRISKRSALKDVIVYSLSKLRLFGWDGVKLCAF